MCIRDSTDADMQDVNMQFHYDDEFMNNPSPAAYERLLQEALEGDASLFTRADGIEQAWRIIDPIIQTWEDGEGTPLAFYEIGSHGPTEADDFLGENDWYSECGGH